MPFHWKEFFVLAEALRDGTVPPHEEARARVAISRAYYAVFHAASAYLISTNDLPESFEEDRQQSAHFQVRSKMLKPGHSRRIDLADDLRWLFDQRVLADYKSGIPISKPLLEEVCERARDAMSELASLRSSRA